MTKQKAIVLDAMQSGADTSNEIADMTGMRVEIVSHYLSELEKDGVVRKTGRYKKLKLAGPPSLCRELVDDPFH